MQTNVRKVTIKLGQKSKKFLVHEIGDWQKVAEFLVKNFKPGSVITLSGPLGAGKTTLTQFIARELGVKKNAISPTFALIRIYMVQSPTSRVPGQKKTGDQGPRTKDPIRRIVHVDAYRIENEQDALALDLFGEIQEPGTVMLIEWPEKIKKLVAKLKPISVKIDY